MFDLTDFTHQLLAMPGLSGHERRAAGFIKETWKDMTDELSVSSLGSLHGLHRGCAKDPRSNVLLTAHMDVIGLMVTGIRQGFIFFTEIGGIDDRILPGMTVTIHGRQPLRGIIVEPPDFCLPPECQTGKTVPKQFLMIDTGLPADEVASLVRTGDTISFAMEPVKLSGDTLTAAGLDDRAAVAAITYCMAELQRTRHDWDVWFAATTQEEVSLGGAYTSAFQIRPDIAIAVDVTFGRQHDLSDYRTFPLGKGPTLGVGANIHPAVRKTFKELAEKLDIPFQMEMMPVFSGTDAWGMQVTAEGIPTMVIGIPVRYMHSAVEMVCMKDIERAGRLLVEFIKTLKTDYINQIVWDD